MVGQVVDQQKRSFTVFSVHPHIVTSKRVRRVCIFLYFVAIVGFYTTAQRIEIIGVPNADSPPFLLSGNIYDIQSGEPLPGANIFIEKQQKGTSTNESGAYELSLYQGVYAIAVSYAGYERKVRSIHLKGNGKLNIGLAPSITSLEEVVVTSGGGNTFVDQKSGIETLSVERISELPNMGGEVDIVRSLTLLPGISSPGETTGGFNVRGGNYDQNLILLEGSTLFNASHLFGFVSAFNPSIIRSANLYKGYVPPRLGGRGSSVLEINEKKGNLTEWEGDVSIGMLSSKFGIGGPVIPDKLSILTGFRQSYANWLFKKAKEGNINNSRASFYDYNIILAYAINEKNDLQFSTYGSSDEFQFATTTSNAWINRSNALRYSRVVNDRLTINLSGNLSEYISQIDDTNEFTGSTLETGVIKRRADLNAKFSVFNTKNTLGGEFVEYESNPGVLTVPAGSSIQPDEIDQKKAHLLSLYYENEFSLSKFSFSTGIRASGYASKGPDTISIYAPELPRRTQNIIGTDIQTGTTSRYGGLEPRIGINYKINEAKSIKASYNRMLQYIHLVSNTTAIAPTDLWKLSDTYILPQKTEQFALGYFMDLGLVDASVEGYYKTFTDLIEYKDGADLFINKNIETEVFQDDGYAFGMEVYLEKKAGRLNGWLSYTFSRSLRKSESVFTSETINEGNIYPANFDQPHNLSVVMNYQLDRITAFSSTFSYQSGRPATLPDGRIRLANNILGYFNERNNGRIPDYHRLDIAFKFHWPSRHLILDGDWILSIYNVYGRNNAFSVFFRDPLDGPPEAFKLAIVGSAFPSISYNFKF